MSPPVVEEGLSHASLSFEGGGRLTLWADPTTTRDFNPAADTRLALSPERPIVVGRQDGGEVPYLDPAYQPTPIVPGTDRAVIGRGERDICVSRGHFLLAAAGDGLMLVNGVPRRGGGVRTPLNGTLMVEPQWRRMEDGEEYLIRAGERVCIQLPNGTRVVIRADG
jgi:hypothetical protein